MDRKNILIVAGNPDLKKYSGVANKMMACFQDQGIGKRKVISLFNGHLPKSVSNSDLIIWAPDISNEKPKDYPKKDIGSVLICSKVMRLGYTRIDAITRIFKMRANAVVAIYKDNPKKIFFELIDALGNTWCNTDDIRVLCSSINDLYEWTKASIRKSLTQYPLEKLPRVNRTRQSVNNLRLQELVKINFSLATTVQTAIGQRYFGNLSTRCMKLFPSLRDGIFILVSPRNIDKSALKPRDFVYTNYMDFAYYGNVKPSVDTPIQLALYARYSEIKYMIHGHARILEAPSTENYVPCGDMREVDEICKVWGDSPRFINLKNHGFLIVAKTLEELRVIIDDAKIVSL